MKQMRTGFAFSVTTLSFLFLAAFLLIPLFHILSISFISSSGGFTLFNYWSLLQKGFYQSTVTNSLMIGALATTATVAVGVPLAFCVARLAIPGKSALMALAVLPLVLPSFVGAYAIVLLFGRSGVITQMLNSIGIPVGSIYGTPGMVLVFTLHLFPYVLLPTVAAFKAVDVSMEEAGQNLGASRFRTIWTVVLPIVLPAILSGALLVFMEVLESIGVPIVLAEDMPLLAIETYKLFVGELGGNPTSAAVLAVLLVTCTTTLLLLQRHFLSRRRFATGARRAPPLIQTSRGLHMAAATFAWGVIFLSLVPFFAIVAISFMKFRGPVLHSEFSIDNFVRLFERSQMPLMNTLLLATVASVGAAVIGVPIGYVVTRVRSNFSHLLDVISTAPFAVAGTVLGIGLVLSYNDGPLVLTGTGLILVIAYMVRKLPFNVRASSSILHQIDPSLEEASVNLGVPPAKTFLKMTLPLMISGVIGGMVLTWVTIVSELSATIVLFSPQWTTITVVMLEALEGNNPGIATSSATVLIAVTILPLVLVYRLLRRHEAALL